MSSYGKQIKVVTSGGFDPITPGHIEYFKRAKKLGDVLVVILNTDRFLEEKKGYVFMPFEDRQVIIESIKYVDAVVKCIDEDQTVAETIKLIKPNIFAKGGDRDSISLPMAEVNACAEVGCNIVTGLGAKTHSSSWYTKDLKEKNGYTV